MANTKIAVFELLNILPIVTFMSSSLIRVTDPVFPQIAQAMDIHPGTAVLLSTAFTLPYALVQPVLGPLSDGFGKTRVIFVCLVITFVATVAGSLAVNFHQLVAARIVAGAAAGGLIPIVLALVADRVPLSGRRVALSRIMTGAMLGNFLGSLFSGVIADLVGWRGGFIFLASVGALGAVALGIALRTGPSDPPARLDIRGAGRSLGVIFANWRAKYCFAVVFVEGMAMFGLMPFVSVFLHDAGESRASIAGIVLAAFALGALVYALSTRRLLQIASENQLTLVCAPIVAVCMVLLSVTTYWPAMMAVAFVNAYAIFTIHGWFQVQVSELAPKARGAAMSLLSFFMFMGMAVGPVLYRTGFRLLGQMPTVAIAASVFLIACVVTALAFSRRPGEPRTE